VKRTAEQERVANQVETVLAERFPDVELIDVALRGGRQPAVTLFIDRPAGVDLDLCVAVSGALDDLRSTYSIEVSSPGLDRPLTRPAHFERAVGEVVALRTETPLAGRSNFRGQLVCASEAGIQLAPEDGEQLSLAYEDIARANVVHQFTTPGGRHE
jgi:ribosome maturation factor RimP